MLNTFFFSIVNFNSRCSVAFSPMVGKENMHVMYQFSLAPRLMSVRPFEKSFTILRSDRSTAGCTNSILCRTKKTDTAVPPPQSKPKKPMRTKHCSLINNSAILQLYQSRKVSSCKKRLGSLLHRQLRIGNIMSYDLHTCFGR